MKRIFMGCLMNIVLLQASSFSYEFDKQPNSFGKSNSFRDQSLNQNSEEIFCQCGCGKGKKDEIAEIPPDEQV